MNELGPLVRVKKVTPLKEFWVQIEFEDGTQKEINLKPFLRGPIFEAIREDARLFKQVRIDGGTIVWANGADIDPDVLYYDLKPAWMDEKEGA